jgi:hypothetical protein
MIHDKEWGFLLYYDPRGEYIGLNVYDMTPMEAIYGDKCICNRVDLIIKGAHI